MINEMQALWKMIQAYGFTTVLTLVVVMILAWLLRIVLRNPVTVLSDVLNDVNTARKTLHEENEAKQRRIEKLEEKVDALLRRVDELERELEQHREAEAANG